MILAAFQGAARFVWTRDRKILLAFAAAYAVIFISCRMFAPEQVFTRVPLSLAFLWLVPFFLPLALLVGTANVTTLQLRGFEGNFPRLFFTLPIKAHEMVLPFIAYSLLLTALLWLASTVISHGRILMFGPPGTPQSAETIAYWLPLLATSLLAWIQAIIWSPFAFGWLRIAVLLTTVFAHIAVLILYAQGVLTQTEIAGLSLLQIPFAILVAARGVARDRGGTTQSRTSSAAATSEDIKSATKAARRRRLRTFSSAMDAQLWFESQVHRWKGIVIYAVPLLPFVLFIVLDILGMAEKNPTSFRVLGRITVTMLLWLPVAIAFVVGFTFASFRLANRWHYKNAFTIPAFFAALPLSTGDFLWAKLTTMTTKTLWCCSGALLACAWVASRAGILDFSSLLAARQSHGAFTATAILATPVLAFVLLLVSGAASLMSLCLAGRGWNWLNSVNATRYLIGGLGISAVSSYWGTHKIPPPGLPEILAVLAVAKMTTVAVLTAYVGKRRLLSWSRLAVILALWLSTVGALLAAALGFVPEAHISLPTLVSLLIVLAPVQGTLAAPLALHLNRVR